MLITQRYTLYHVYYIYANVLGHIFEKSGEIRIRDGCVWKRVEHRVKHRSTVIRVKHCLKNGWLSIM